MSGDTTRFTSIQRDEDVIPDSVQSLRFEDVLAKYGTPDVDTNGSQSLRHPTPGPPILLERLFGILPSTDSDLAGDWGCSAIADNAYFTMGAVISGPVHDPTGRAHASASGPVDCRSQNASLRAEAVPEEVELDEDHDMASDNQGGTTRPPSIVASAVGLSTRNKAVNAEFIKKLAESINHPTRNDRWIRWGTKLGAVLINVKDDAFIVNVYRPQWRGRKADSFFRQMRDHGFTKTGVAGDFEEWTNRLFRQGRSDLIEQIIRKPPKAVGSTVPRAGGRLAAETTRREKAEEEVAQLRRVVAYLLRVVHSHPDVKARFAAAQEAARSSSTAPGTHAPGTRDLLPFIAVQGGVISGTQQTVAGNPNPTLWTSPTVPSSGPLAHQLNRGPPTAGPSVNGGNGPCGMMSERALHPYIGHGQRSFNLPIPQTFSPSDIPASSPPLNPIVHYDDWINRDYLSPSPALPSTDHSDPQDYLHGGNNHDQSVTGFHHVFSSHIPRQDQAGPRADVYSPMAEVPSSELAQSRYSNGYPPFVRDPHMRH